MHPFGPRAPASDGGFVLLARAFAVSLILHVGWLLTASVEAPPRGGSPVVQASLRTAAQPGLGPAVAPSVLPAAERKPQPARRHVAEAGGRARRDRGLAQGEPLLADTREDPAAPRLSPQALAEFRLQLAERLQGRIRLSPGESWRLALQWRDAASPELHLLAIDGAPPAPGHSAALTQEAALIDRPGTLRRIELLFVAAIE